MVSGDGVGHGAISGGFGTVIEINVSTRRD